ncbi:MAG: hypothetical protein KZQ64_15775 [gamma proteobacterium symbiont of Bathyaustriella thionipta]|nr:hypothetical protein [gamma proteobacterium symbiont of Bathyaustriella thionipta]MCU7949636.1 hypothetical protein [gamma proteobacterium symbiont of Bathyaustriella thionipta]MCU7954827.1 hypothetical protein [gamma proteobacterium symbiont of Bathyaustriella thionipta]MCU7956215.1 hypothetical protein [gamma proteobacterium symbiont of Bathyaustriella thionipta]
MEQHKKPESVQQVLTKEQIHDLLQVLAEKLQQGDYIDTAEFESIKTGSSDNGLQNVFKQLMEQIAQFDSNAALKTIQNIEAQLNVTINPGQKEDIK